MCFLFDQDPGVHSTFDADNNIVSLFSLPVVVVAATQVSAGQMEAV